MPSYRFPGVYLQELALQPRPIIDDETSAAAFVGRCRMGSLDRPFELSSYADFESSFGGGWTESALPQALQDFFENGGRKAIVVRVARGAQAAKFSLPNATSSDALELHTATPGGWGKALRVSIFHDAPESHLFRLVATETTGGATETYPTLSTRPRDSNFVGTVLRQSSHLLRVRRQSGRWRCPAERPAAIRGAVATAGSASDGSQLQAVNLVSSYRQRRRLGLYALEKADGFNLLCIPGYRSDGGVDKTVSQAAAHYCEAQQAIFLAEAPIEWTSSAQAIANPSALGTKSPNAAVFYPSIQKPDPASGSLRTLSPVGSIAGVIARTDTLRGVWKAPAGLEATLLGATALDPDLPTADAAALNRLAINCLRLYGGKVLVWGARTLSGQDAAGSEWKYMPVRRLALHIERSIRKSTRWTVFEGNDANLWQSLENATEAYLNTLYRNGALNGSKASEAYFVRCGQQTTTAADLQNRRVNLQLGIAPLKPAEFVVLTLTLPTGPA